MSESGDIILYQDNNGETKIQVTVYGETVWLSIDQMADLFQRDKSVIAKHIKNVIADGELPSDSVVANFATTASDGKTYQVSHYNLDMIISVGYRVNSHRGVQFRIWATKALREYMVKGFVIDDERLSGKQTNYFDELVERVRRIRTSEVNFYTKVRAVFATSIDYDPNTEPCKLFYATVQNKFHYAITGLTAAEIVAKRVNAHKPKMGLITTKGHQPTRQEAETAKNYLEETELKRLELLVEQFLSFAELQSLEKRPMYMTDWVKKLDDFIRFNEKQVLSNAGSISSERMKQIVHEEYEVYRQKLLLEDGDHDPFFKLEEPPTKRNSGKKSPKTKP